MPGQALRSRSWDGQSVLYNEVTGATHLLDGLTLDLLHAVRDGTLSDADWDDPQVQQALSELGLINLVEPC